MQASGRSDSKVRVYAGSAGYLLDVQADLLEHLNIRTAVPLQPTDEAPTPGRVLNPLFMVDGQPLVMVTQFASAMYRSELGRVVVTRAPKSDTMTCALDIAVQGF